MGQLVEIRKNNGVGDFNLDALLGIQGEPSAIDFSLDSLILVHAGLGFLAALFLPPVGVVAAAVVFAGYQLSQVDEDMASTSTEIVEFGLGMAAGAVLRQMTSKLEQYLDR